MGRLAADRPRRLRGHAHFWSVIMDLHRDQGLFTVQDVDRQTSAHLTTVRDYLRRLQRAGIVEQTGEMRGPAKLYRMVKPAPEAPSVDRDGRVNDRPSGTEQMWRTMKMRGAFTADELAEGASTDDVAVAPRTAKAYCTALHRAGYLTVIGKPDPRGGRTRYRLAPSMMTGPKAPMIQRVKRVFDPNLGRVMWTEPGDE